MVSIETFNRCNGTCSFCPVNRNINPLKPQKMTEDLFIHILENLKEMEFKGRLALYANNEPLLDDRIYDFAVMARSYVPDAFIYFFTNGTLLDLEKCRLLAKSLDRIVIDNYDDDLTLHDNIIPIAEACKSDQDLDKKVEIHLRKQNEVLSSRGGQAPNVTKKVRRTFPCVAPFNEFTIHPDGRVSICCDDALGKMTYWNVAEMRIEEIWHSDKYKEIRNKIICGHISDLEICRYCDTIRRLKTGTVIR
ncbi:MAG: SPASM domain-containing protein [Clostridiales bacterium]|nr:SPASM domain-containing protein [Clostridiales bacterium]